MSEAESLIDLIKTVAVNIGEDNKPMAFSYGKVSSVKPLKIQLIDPVGDELREDQLHLTDMVRDHYIKLEAYDSHEESEDYHVTEKQNQDHKHQILNVPVVAPPSAGTANGMTENQSAETDHDHNYKGGVFKFRLGLKQGEKVLLLRVQGGQSYIVLCRYDPPKGEEGSEPP